MLLWTQSQLRHVSNPSLAVGRFFLGRQLVGFKTREGLGNIIRFTVIRITSCICVVLHRFWEDSIFFVVLLYIRIVIYITFPQPC